MRAIVIGAGGIGSAVAARLTLRGDEVLHLSRRSSPAIDLLDPQTIDAAAEAAAAFGPINLLFIATGGLHGDGLEAEKSLRAIDGEAMTRAFRLNTVGPALAIRAFVPLLARDRRAVIAALSARVGSIADNRLGGWYSYRASKAALNQIVKTASIELARSHPQAIIVGLHPGTVDTDLSRPFQRNLRDGQLVGPEQSAANLIGVIDRLTPAETGACLDWQGSIVPP